MRHRKSFNHLGRTSSHRKAMLSNMATSLILNKRITTTVAKAKALRGIVEPLITKSKNDTTHSRRIAFSYLKDKFAVTELFRNVSQKVGDRPGGYTRIIKLGKRLGDNAEMAMIELVDFNELLISEKDSKPKTRRRRRGGSKSTTTNAPAASKPAAEKAEDTKVENVVEEAEVVEETKEKEEPVAETKEDAQDNETSDDEAKEEDSKK